MPISKPSTKRLAEQWRNELTAAHKAVARTHDRDAIYGYLKLVYEKFRSTPASQRVQIVRILAAATTDADVLPLDAFFYILRATASSATPQAINKWKKCLMRARADRVPPNKLIEVIKAAGGINHYLAKADLKHKVEKHTARTVRKAGGEAIEQRPSRRLSVKVSAKG